MGFKSDIEIAQEAELMHINEIAKIAGVGEDYLELYGKYKAKVDYNILNDLKDKENGKLILVTAINPTPAGEGKTTVSVGLGDALRKIGKNSGNCTQRTFPRTGIRCQGRSCRRRIRTGHSDGRYQSAFYR